MAKMLMCFQCAAKCCADFECLPALNIPAKQSRLPGTIVAAARQVDFQDNRLSSKRTMLLGTGAVATVPLLIAWAGPAPM